MIRSLATLLLLLNATGDLSHLRYQRAISIPAPGQNCVTLDPAVYIHAAPSLADLRLVVAGRSQELPFALLVNGAISADTDSASILNVHMAGHALAFDLQLPSRLYTDVVLHLASSRLLAHAAVSAAGSSLGDFTLFDLSADHLPADTTLHLQETSAPLLHVTVTPFVGAPSLTPDVLKSATVPPSREAQTLFTTALATSTLEQTSHQTIAHFSVPAHLPIDRVHLTLLPGKAGNFTRPVRVLSHIAGEPESSGEQISGTFGHLRLERAGASLHFDQISIPATLGANLQKPANVQVIIENGTAAPLPIASIALETRQRQLCFNAPSAPVTLLYGDPKLDPSDYDDARRADLTGTIQTATLGPEQSNPRYLPREPGRPFMRRHPRLFYLGSIFAICLVAIVALRSKKLRI